MFKKIINWFFPKKEPFFTVHEVMFIPSHIKFLGKQYPLVFDPDNKAAGEIRILSFKEGRHFYIGQVFMSTDKFGVVSIWIYLGHDYFKLIMKS